MTEKIKDKKYLPKFFNYYNNLPDFLHDYVICAKLDEYFRETLQSEEALLYNAVKNRRKLKILEGYLDEVRRNPNSRIVDSVNRFIILKSKVFLIRDKVPIALKIANLAITGANEEKKTLEAQLDANEQILIANTKVDSKQKEKEKVDEEMEKITPNLKSYKSSEDFQNYIKEFLKSYNKKLNKFGKNQKGDNMASENIEREKRKVLLESVKPSNKTIKPSPEEKNLIISEESNQDIQCRLKCLNLDIEGFELKLSLLEKVLKFLQEFETVFPFSVYRKTSNNFKDDTEKQMDSYVHDIDKIIDDPRYVNDADNIKKVAIRSIFLDQTTTTVSSNVSTSDIQKVHKVSSSTLSKSSDKSTPDDIFKLDSKTFKNNNEADELVKNLRFKIDTDGKKIFTIAGQDFKVSESQRAVINCKNEKVKISFNDNQVFVSTEKCEFHISIKEPKSINILDNCSQTESTQ